MAGGIKEGDGLPIDLHLVGADVLGDAAGLALGHVGVADIVKEGGLAMIHVAHNHHHRGPVLQILGLVLGGVDELLLDGNYHLALHLAAHLLGDDGGGVKVDKLADTSHDAVLHQALDHLGGGLFHAAGQLPHADLVGDQNLDGGLFGDLQLEPAHLLLLLLTTLVGEGLLAPLFAAGVAELLLALLLHGAASLGGPVSDVLQTLVVLLQIHVGGLPGVHHLFLRDAAHGLGRLLRLLRTLLGLALLALLAALSGLLGPSALLTALTLLGLTALLALLATALASALTALGLVGLTLLLDGLLFLLLIDLGEDCLNAGRRVLLGEAVENHRQLTGLQYLHVVFRCRGILGEDLRDGLGGQAEILGHLVHSVFVDDITQ